MDEQAHDARRDDRIADALQQCIGALDGIASADWRKWEDYATAEGFAEWAKSRARWQADLARAALAAQPQEPSDEACRQSYEELIDANVEKGGALSLVEAAYIAGQRSRADQSALVDALRQCVDVLADIMLDGAGRIVGLRRYSLARIALAAARAALAAQAPAREPTPEESDRG